MDIEHRKKHSRDELVELIWHLGEIHESTLEAMKTHTPQEGYEEDLARLKKEGVITIEGNIFSFTGKGREIAKNIIRRHRLAERMLSDVLDKKPDETENAACEFEHILAPEIVDSICILLGHPKNCPHGRPIPEGDCCKEARSQIEAAFIPLSQLETGMSAKVAFINTNDEARMLKLMSMGLTPGTIVKLNQKVPALVVEIDSNLVAFDTAIGNEINVLRQPGAKKA
jgi:DtxR family Mn-dependent transcriptional regulator